MSSFRVLNRQTRYVATTAAMLLATIAQGVVPAIASADQVTSRSIELSSSAKTATNVTYTVNFTAAKVAGAFVVDFCNNSPLIGATCTAPGGFDASSATTTTPGATVAPTTNKVVVTDAITAGENVSVNLAGIKNPSTIDPLYARILTYTDAGGATAYTSTSVGSPVDTGGVAIAITDSIGVSAAVLEAMTFCVSGATIAANCTNANATPPTLTLGQQQSPGVIALSSGAVSQGDIYTQISTNAASGAIVRLKSNAVQCGGLLRAGAALGTCDIAPAGDGTAANDITAGKAKFGVKVAADTAADTTLGASGTFEPVSGSGYNSDHYAMNYVAGDASGVTSVYGDPLLDTAAAPVNNRNMALTFGASVSNNTPAGNYSADLSLIATGKF